MPWARSSSSGSAATASSGPPGTHGHVPAHQIRRDSGSSSFTPVLPMCGAVIADLAGADDRSVPVAGHAGLKLPSRRRSPSRRTWSRRRYVLPDRTAGASPAGPVTRTRPSGELPVEDGGRQRRGGDHPSRQFHPERAVPLRRRARGSTVSCRRVVQRQAGGRPAQRAGPGSNRCGRAPGHPVNHPGPVGRPCRPWPPALRAAPQPVMPNAAVSPQFPSSTGCGVVGGHAVDGASQPRPRAAPPRPPGYAAAG